MQIKFVILSSLLICTTYEFDLFNVSLSLNFFRPVYWVYVSNKPTECSTICGCVDRCLCNGLFCKCDLYNACP